MGSGVSHGIYGIGGATGDGMRVRGGTTSGIGLNAYSDAGSNDPGAKFTGNGTGDGVECDAAGSGKDIDAAEIDTIDSKIDALNDVSTAEVNAEILDVLNTDTFAEPGQEAPGTTVSLVKKISYLYKFLRNKITNDGTTIEVYNDAKDTVDQKSTVSEAAGTVTRDEFESGP
jgi:hypothetical protein